MKARHILVSGKVQGVGYRFFVFQQAQALGLWGWVQNLPDSRVEIKVWGGESIVDQFIELLKKGPPRASVDKIIINEVSESVASKEFIILR